MSFALKKEYLPNYSYDDYCQWEGKWELIQGVPYAMSPAPTGKHQWLSGQLYSQFKDQLNSCNKCNVSMPMDWKIDEETVLQPDLFIACFEFRNSNYITQAPVLIVEVLSPSNRNKDLSLKKEIYQANGVKYFVVIDPDDDSYIVHELSGKEYKVAQAGHTDAFTFKLDECNAAIDFGKIFSA